MNPDRPSGSSSPRGKSIPSGRNQNPAPVSRESSSANSRLVNSSISRSGTMAARVGESAWSTSLGWGRQHRISTSVPSRSRSSSPPRVLGRRTITSLPWRLKAEPVTTNQEPSAFSGSSAAPSPTIQHSPPTARSTPASRRLSSRWAPVPSGTAARRAIRESATSPVSSPVSPTSVTNNLAWDTESPIQLARNRCSGTMSYNRQASTCQSRLENFQVFQELAESSGTVAVAPANARRPSSLIRGRFKATGLPPHVRDHPGHLGQGQGHRGDQEEGVVPPKPDQGGCGHRDPHPGTPRTGDQGGHERAQRPG